VLVLACRESLTKGKLTLSIFHGSTVARQLDVLAGYRCEVEVCAQMSPTGR